MFGHYFALYNHIINIDFNVPTQLWFQHFSHHPLINRPYFKFSHLKRSGYIISTALPWSIIILFTSYPPILSVTTKALLCGCTVPSLSLFEKPNTNGIPILILFGIELKPSSGQQDIDITLEGQDSVLPRAANMTFIVPRGGLEDASP